MPADPHKPADFNALPCRKIQVKIPCPLINKIEKEATETGVKRSKLIVRALELYFKNKGGA